MNEQLARELPTASAGDSARIVAYRIIRDKIIHLALKPGEALSDKLLAEELGMSRTPVREAIIVLSISGMVVLRPQVGTFVAPIDPERVEVEQFSRRAVEKEILRLACGHTPPAIAARYAENLREYAEAVGAPSPEGAKRLLELDNSFHSLAFEAVGRENCFRQVQRNMQHIERLRVLSLMLEDGRRLTEDHARISSALLAGDEADALAQLDVHLTRYRDSLSLVRERFPEYFTIG